MSCVCSTESPLNLGNKALHFIELFCIHIEADPQLENLLEKYHQQPKIKHKSLKCLFTGPPRVGKTTLKKRLLKVIKNLISSGIVSPSGGLEKPISVIIGETRECVTVVIESDVDWKPQHNLLDEAQIVLEFIDHQPSTSHQAPLTPKSVSPIPVHTQVSLDPVPPTPVPRTPVPPTPVPPTPVPPTPAPFIPISSIPASPKPDPSTPEVGKVDEVKQLMQKVLDSRGYISQWLFSLNIYWYN